MTFSSVRTGAFIFCAILLSACADLDARIELVAPFEAPGPIPSFVATSERTRAQTAIVLSSTQNADEIMDRHGLHHLYLVAMDCEHSDEFETIAYWYPETNEPRPSIASADWVHQNLGVAVESQRFYYVAFVSNNSLQSIRAQKFDCVELRAGAMWGLGRLRSTRLALDSLPIAPQP